MNIGVADAIKVGEHRHPRIGLNPGDQALAAARHDRVDQARCGEHRAHCRAILGWHQLHGILGHSRRSQTLDQRRMDCPV